MQRQRLTSSMDVSILATRSRLNLRRTMSLVREVDLFLGVCMEEAGQWVGEEGFPQVVVDSLPVVGRLDFVVVAWDVAEEEVALAELQVTGYALTQTVVMSTLLVAQSAIVVSCLVQMTKDPHRMEVVVIGDVVGVDSIPVVGLTDVVGDFVDVVEAEEGVAPIGAGMGGLKGEIDHIDLDAPDRRLLAGNFNGCGIVHCYTT